MTIIAKIKVRRTKTIIVVRVVAMNGEISMRPQLLKQRLRPKLKHPHRSTANLQKWNLANRSY